jgi:hypothetical protein
MGESVRHKHSPVQAISVMAWPRRDAIHVIFLSALLSQNFVLY